MITEIKDSFNRKISYLRLSVTDKCNLKCAYCYSFSDKIACPNSYLNVDEIFKLVQSLAEVGINKVRITGGEPLMRNNITDIILKISQIKNINDISITTNGVLLEKFAEKLFCSGLKRINISLDSLDPETYNKINGGNLKNVLNGISHAKKFFYNIRINVVLLKGINEKELSDFIEFGIENNLTIRFLELMPVKAMHFQSTQNIDFNQHFLSIETAIAKLEKKYLLTPVKSNEKVSTAQWFDVDSGKTRVGFIAPLTSPFCSECNRIRVTSSGNIFPCLHDEYHVFIRNFLAKNIQNEILNEAINNILQKKIFKHKLNESKKSESDIMFIGG